MARFDSRAPVALRRKAFWQFLFGAILLTGSIGSVVYQWAFTRVIAGAAMFMALLGVFIGLATTAVGAMNARDAASAERENHLRAERAALKKG